MLSIFGCANWTDFDPLNYCRRNGGKQGRTGDGIPLVVGDGVGGKGRASVARVDRFYKVVFWRCSQHRLVETGGGTAANGTAANGIDPNGLKIILCRGTVMHRR